jgi:hypothetical protein
MQMTDSSRHINMPVGSKTYYFDILPYHPQPERLESFTSYLMRLAGANSILSMDGLSALCFPHHERRD